MSESDDIRLDFPMLNYGATATPLNLRPLLYRGGSSVRVKIVNDQIDAGELGAVIPGRVDLVKRIHEEITDDLVGGGSRISAQNKISALKGFFAWCDRCEENVSIESVAIAFIHWSDHLIQLYRVNKSITQVTLYDKSRLVATLLDRALGREASLSKNTRVCKPKREGNFRYSDSDKQDLQKTFAFGHALTDICEALTWEASVASLPVSIKLRTGQAIQLWSGLIDPEKIKGRRLKVRKPVQLSESSRARAAHEEDRTIRTRYPLINLRIASELCIFIAQTGLNFTQAHTLRMDQFHYTSHLDGYQVRSYKRRREGEVLFEIFQDYKKWFERYLKFREQWFPDDPDGLVFPLVRIGGRLPESAPQLTALMRVMGELGIEIIGPRKLRGVRINWLLRETQDPNQVAEWAQHSVETLKRVYSIPHAQVAKIEISRFHQKNDMSMSSPAPGRCLSITPTPVDNIPTAAPLPDCINAAGCLFCTQHRDIESQDHVWSLSSLQHLKVIELSRYSPGGGRSNVSPSLTVVERIAAKLHFFEDSSIVRRQWVQEARARVAEGNYHPAWDGFIRLVEIGDASL